MSAHPLLESTSVGDLRRYLDTVGTVFRVFDRQDSGCVSYGVAVDAERWFVKTSTTPPARRALGRAVTFHAAVRHPVIIGLRARFVARAEPVLVYPWVDGVLLHHATVDRGLPRRDPASAWSRFRRLPVAQVEAAMDAIFDAHLAVDRAGFVASDLYDGCFLYDFKRRLMRLLDFDEFRPGPFVATEPPCGSSRFMAPEEVLGGTFDRRTTVFTLGRAARLLLTPATTRRPGGGPLASSRSCTGRPGPTRPTGTPTSATSSRPGAPPRREPGVGRASARMGA